MNNKSMTTKSRTMNIGRLCALALGAGMAAQGAAPVISDTALVPRFTIQSDLGVPNQIQYCTNLGQANWVVLTNLVVTQSTYWFVDVDAPPAPRRFSRVVVLVPSGMTLIPAGSFTMGNCMDSGEGLFDELPLHTAYEWCWDWYGGYSSGSQTDPRGPASGSYRVFRGGGWNGYAFYCRSAVRFGYGPATIYDYIGFRPVLPLGQ